MRASFTTFRNCITGVLVTDYHRFDGNDPAEGPEMPNRNFFAGCVFETTEDWPDGAPFAMGMLQNVRHVRFLNCSFANEAPEVFTSGAKGTGLWLDHALAYVDGSGNAQQSFFRNLDMGVYNASGLFNPVRVQRMHFESNWTGIFDANSNSPEYGSNTFHVVDPAVPEVAGVGIYMWETKDFTVEDNTFTGNQEANTVGIYFYGQQAGPKGSAPEDWTYYEERIYNNSFTGLQGGTVVDGVHRGDASTDVDYGLQLLCGDYTDNQLDIALNARSLIKPNQGTPPSNLDAGQLAGNRFFNIDCNDSRDWTFDDLWNDVEGNMSTLINYKRHETPFILTGVECAGLPDLHDIEIAGSGTFNKTAHCGNGEYPIQQGSLGDRRGAYIAVKSLLTAVINTYEGTVDLGEKPDLIEAIQQQDPVLSSAFLRDLLLSKHPLSDEVIGLALAREVPLDPWHLTQVLLQNSPLSQGIWRNVQGDELLSPYFLAMVAQAQQGNGLTMKQALELEISERRAELAAHKRVLGAIYARDTTDTPVDSLAALVLYDKDPENAARRLEALIRLGRYPEADALLRDGMAKHLGREIYEDILAMHQATGGEWVSLGQSDREQLRIHAESGRTGAAWAWSILTSLKEEVAQPPVRFPVHTKNRRTVATYEPTGADAEPTIACFPNPSNANSFVTYPSFLDGSTLLLMDAKG
ncbi:MAG TPA: hypothetical protein PKN30_10735, partial [Flavobacteriales bacterium]|nr:hypothetical protein [Flavobacteriales bacterium]